MVRRKRGDSKQATMSCLIKYETVIPHGIAGKDYPKALIFKQLHQFRDITITMNGSTYCLPIDKSEWSQKDTEVEIGNLDGTIVIDGYLLTQKGRILDVVTIE